jgi:hypothetical protein
LRFELANLKNETAKLRCMIYNSWTVWFLSSVLNLEIICSNLFPYPYLTQKLGKLTDIEKKGHFHL